MADALVRYRFSVGEWQEMGRLGLFDEDARLELIDGEVVEMTPIGDRHAICVGRLTRFFSELVGDDALVWVQNPVRLDDYSEPQPDVTLLRPPLDRYTSHPRPADVLLVVEVADSSLARDRIKSRRYARSGIPECWIVDLAAEAVAVLRQPCPDGYTSEQKARRGDTLDIVALAGRTVEAAQVFGPQQ